MFIRTYINGMSKIHILQNVTQTKLFIALMSEKNRLNQKACLREMTDMKQQSCDSLEINSFKWCAFQTAVCWLPEGRLVGHNKG